jgi:hypothetical protein
MHLGAVSRHGTVGTSLGYRSRLGVLARASEPDRFLTTRS